MNQQTTRRYCPESNDRLSEAVAPSADGARAALESFYYALNQCDGDVLRRVWADHRLVQLNNALGGILHGGDAISRRYGKIFSGPLHVEEP